MKRLFLAEKASLATAIAGHLWPNGYEGKEKGSHYFYHGDDIVTWTQGHILAMYQPEDYDAAWKTWDVYPIFPKEWKNKPYARMVEHFKVIQKLIKDAKEVIHAGDPDREGQGLITDVLNYCNYTGPVQRLLMVCSLIQTSPISTRHT